MSHCILTIGIPTFNRSINLEETLINVLPQVELHNQQSEWKIEVLVCDNCSTDDTEIRVSNYLEEFDFLRYHKNPDNIGMMRNLERAAQLSKGEYYWPLGDDDFIYPTCLSRFMAFMEEHKNKNLGLISLGYEDICVNKIYPTVQRKHNLESQILVPSNPIGSHFGALRLLFVSATIYKTELFLEKKYFDRADPAELATHLQIIYDITSNHTHAHFSLPVVIGSRITPNKWGGMWAVMIGYELAKLTNEVAKYTQAKKVVRKIIPLKNYLYSYTMLALFRDDYKSFYQKARELKHCLIEFQIGKRIIDTIFDLKFIRNIATNVAKKKDPDFELKRRRIRSYLEKLEPLKS